MINVENLSKSYGSKQVLFDLNLNFAKGQVYGIVGNNGAGKTTLFKCIAGLEEHTGIIKSEYSLLKNYLGFLETNPIVMSRITGWEYLKLLCTARNIEAHDFEAQNIFDLPLDQFADTYSTGMKKKLAILGVLLQENEVFILDEPFNGVDIQSNMIITEIIQQLKAHNKTIIISSHIFSTLSNNCDQIYLLEAGRLKKEISPEDFITLEEELKKSVVGDRLSKLKF